METAPPFILGIAGGSGSGKTTLAHYLAKELPWHVLVVELDQFYKDLAHLKLEQRLQANFDHPESLDFAAITEVLSVLRCGEATEVPIYDIATCVQTGKTRTIFPSAVILVEGMQILHHEPLAEQFDHTVFLDIPEEIRWKRKLKRDIEERQRSYQSVLDMWNTRTKPMHSEFVQPTAGKADSVYTHTTTQVILDDVTKHIEAAGVPNASAARKVALNAFSMQIQPS